jgi:glycosyltransferase involved in cell wall biosynthesis
MELGIAFFILAGFVLLNCIYYLSLSKIISYQDLPGTSKKEPVSVIVCSKNEQNNLLALVPILLEQEYPNFEIILINDASTDNTLDIIENFVAQDNRIKMVDVVNNESFWGNKKYALTLGIKKASYSKHIFIDADCRPLSNKWLGLMTSKMNGDKSIVLGYSGYEHVKGSFLNALIRYETVLTAFQYLSYAIKGNPYMGVGRNLGYTNEQFYAVKGFINHMKIIGGDDDLFVNEAATSKNTTILIDPEGFTISKPKTTWKEWITQKQRHVNTAKYYKTRQKLLLGLFYISQLGFVVAAIVGFITASHWEFILALLLIRYIVVWTIIGLAASRFRESELIPYLPVLELSLIFTQCYLFFNSGGKTKSWK